MAISRAQLLKDLLPTLNEIFNKELESLPNTWAVYADYHHEDMTWQIAKIEPWIESKHAESMQHIYKITDQIDEMGAYKAFMQAKEQPGWTS